MVTVGDKVGGKEQQINVHPDVGLNIQLVVEVSQEPEGQPAQHLVVLVAVYQSVDQSLGE